MVSRAVFWPGKTLHKTFHIPMTLKQCTKEKPKIIAAAKLGRVKNNIFILFIYFLIVTSKKYLVISDVKMFKNLYGVIIEVK